MHNLLQTWLAHPLTANVDIDDPSAVELRRRIIDEKPFLRRIYQEQLAGVLTSCQVLFWNWNGRGLSCNRLTRILTSDVFHHRGIDVVWRRLSLPIASDALGAIVMVDVFHTSRRRAYFRRSGAMRACRRRHRMIEPWVTPWSRLVYGSSITSRSALMPWNGNSRAPATVRPTARCLIVFERDRQRFEQDFPDWRIQRIEIQMPFRYLVSEASP